MRLLLLLLTGRQGTVSAVELRLRRQQRQARGRVSAQHSIFELESNRFFICFDVYTGWAIDLAFWMTSRTPSMEEVHRASFLASSCQWLWSKVRNLAEVTVRTCLS